MNICVSSGCSITDVRSCSPTTFTPSSRKGDGQLDATVTSVATEKHVWQQVPLASPRSGSVTWQEEKLTHL